MPEIVSYVDWLPLVLVLRLLKMFTAYFYADPGCLSRIPDPNFSILDTGIRNTEKSVYRSLILGVKYGTASSLKKMYTDLSYWVSSTVKFQILKRNTPASVVSSVLPDIVFRNRTDGNNTRYLP
jgi:hypothetical protein